jgi:hypothetical protein
MSSSRNQRADKKIVPRKIKVKNFSCDCSTKIHILTGMNEGQSEEVSQDGVIDQRVQETKTPAYEAAFDPDEAERIAFREDALSDQDARESDVDS